MEVTNSVPYWYYNNHTEKYWDTDGYMFVFYDPHQLGNEKNKTIKYYTPSN